MSTHTTPGYPAREFNISDCRPSWIRTAIEAPDAEDVRLTDSIRAVGLIQPIRIVTWQNAAFIIDGDRRWKAYRALGWWAIPAYVTACACSNLAAKLRVACVRPSDSYPVRELGAIVAHTWGSTERARQAAAAETGHSFEWITAVVRLRKGPDDVMAALDSRAITVEQAAIIAHGGRAKDRERWIAAAAHSGATAERLSHWIAAAQLRAHPHRPRPVRRKPARINGHPAPSPVPLLDVLNWLESSNSKDGEQVEQHLEDVVDEELSEGS